MEHYSTINEKNESIMTDVELVEKQISIVEEQIESIRLEKRNSDVYECEPPQLQAQKGKINKQGKGEIKEKELSLNQVTTFIA